MATLRCGLSSQAGLYFGPQTDRCDLKTQKRLRWDIVLRSSFAEYWAEARSAPHLVLTSIDIDIGQPQKHILRDRTVTSRRSGKESSTAPRLHTRSRHSFTTFSRTVVKSTMRMPNLLVRSIYREDMNSSCLASGSSIIANSLVQSSTSQIHPSLQPFLTRSSSLWHDIPNVRTL